MFRKMFYFADRKIWLVKRATRLVLAALNREDYEFNRAMARGGDVYEIHTPDAAEYFGYDWPGRPFVVYPEWGYDEFDYLCDMIAGWWYVVSGQEANDLSREYDEQLLANAY